LEEAVRAVGAIARVKPATLEDLLRSGSVETVVEAPRFLLRTTMAGSGIFRMGWQYLVTSKAGHFYSESKQRLAIPAGVRVVEAQDLWVSFLGQK
jgi:hypothetical protein